MLRVEVEANYNDGRPELWFYLTVDGNTTGHYYSVRGMTKAFPRYREAILAACRSLFSNLSVEHHPRLERAIARAS